MLQIRNLFYSFNLNLFSVTYIHLFSYGNYQQKYELHNKS